MAHLKYKWRAARPRVLSGLLYFLVRGVCSTLRFDMRNVPKHDAKLIFCGWHGRSFAFSDFFRKRGWHVIISHSSDGEMQSRIFGRLGYKVIRGST